MVGQSVSHYRILKKLGEGGMGQVYPAQDTRLGRKVALEFISESHQRDPIARRRLLSEAKSAAALDHAFICKVLAGGQQGRWATVGRGDTERQRGQWSIILNTPPCGLLSGL